MVKIMISIAGDKEVQLELHDMEMRAANPEPLWGNLAGMFRKLARGQYASDGARGPGGQWPDLAPSTIAAKARMGGDKRKLRMWGDLYDSLTKKGDGGNLYLPFKDYMIWGSSLDYFKFHQSRRERMLTADGVVKLPRRAVIDPTTVDKLEMGRRVRKWLRGRDMPGDGAGF